MKNLIFLWLFLCTLFCSAQQREKDSIDMDTVYIPKHTVYLELGGNAALYSINYERFIFQGKTIQFSLRFGIGYWGETILSPLMINTLVGKKKHKLEIDIGINGLWDLNFNKREKQKEWIKQGIPLGSPFVPFFRARPTANLGYRYQSGCGLYYKIGFTFLYKMINYQWPYTPWVNIGVGYLFGVNKSNSLKKR